MIELRRLISNSYKPWSKCNGTSIKFFITEPLELMKSMLVGGMSLLCNSCKNCFITLPTFAPSSMYIKDLKLAIEGDEKMVPNNVGYQQSTT
jgi:hypothetical protein